MVEGCPPNQIACADFENGYPAGWGKDLAGGGSVEVATAFGRKALKVTLTPSQGTTANALVRLNGIDRLFGRTRVYIPDSIPRSNGNSHSDVIHGNATSTAVAGSAVYGLHCNPGSAADGGNCLNARLTGDAGKAVHGGLRQGSHKPPVNRWFCLEWHWDGPAGVVQYWFDGVEETSMHVDDPRWKARAFTELTFGWKVRGGATVNTNVYYDDFALAPARIGGCPE